MPTGTLRGRGSNIDGSSDRPLMSTAILLPVTSFGECAGNSQPSAPRLKPSPLAEGVRDQGIGGCVRKNRAQVSLIGVIGHLPQRPGNGLTHHRGGEKAGARHIFRSPARASIAKRMTTTSAVPSRKKNERAVKAMFFCMVMFRSFLRAGTSHGQRKGVVRDNGSSPENWIRYHARSCAAIHQNPSLRIHRRTYPLVRPPDSSVRLARG